MIILFFEYLDRLYSISLNLENDSKITQKILNLSKLRIHKILCNNVLYL